MGWTPEPTLALATPKWGVQTHNKRGPNFAKNVTQGGVRRIQKQETFKAAALWCINRFCEVLWRVTGTHDLETERLSESPWLFAWDFLSSSQADPGAPPEQTRLTSDGHLFRDFSCAEKPLAQNWRSITQGRQQSTSQVDCVSLGGLETVRSSFLRAV